MRIRVQCAGQRHFQKDTALALGDHVQLVADDLAHPGEEARVLLEQFELLVDQHSDVEATLPDLAVLPAMVPIGITDAQAPRTHAIGGAQGLCLLTPDLARRHQIDRLARPLFLAEAAGQHAQLRQERLAGRGRRGNDPAGAEQPLRVADSPRDRQRLQRQKAGAPPSLAPRPSITVRQPLYALFRDTGARQRVRRDAKRGPRVRALAIRQRRRGDLRRPLQRRPLPTDRFPPLIGRDPDQNLLREHLLQRLGEPVSLQGVERGPALARILIEPAAQRNRIGQALQGQIVRRKLRGQLIALAQAQAGRQVYKRIGQVINEKPLGEPALPNGAAADKERIALQMRPPGNRQRSGNRPHRHAGAQAIAKLRQPVFDLLGPPAGQRPADSPSCGNKFGDNRKLSWRRAGLRAQKRSEKLR